LPLRRRFALLGPLLLAAACSSSGSSPTAPPSGDGTSTRIEVRLTDSFRIQPGDFRVPAGEPVTFVVTNGGVLPHEFFVGDEEAQAAQDAAVLSNGGVAEDGPDGVAVQPGATEELTITFDDPGPTLAACHIPGHYASGMKTTVTVVE
jgi:uncharacterized cupredoxin-like copper-binding protein